MRFRWVVFITVLGLVLSLSRRSDAAYTFTRIASDFVPLSSFLNLSHFPSLNDSGTVAFWGERPFPYHGTIFKGNGGPLTLIAGLGGDIDSLSDYTTINNSGKVAFKARLGLGRGGIFVGDGGPINTIVDTNTSPFSAVENPSINDSGKVAFWAVLDAGGEGIFVSDGTTTTTIADDDGPFDIPFTGSFPALNNSGKVAFQADLDTPGESGIFIGDGTT
ncbi:MAG: hypothetical protein NZT92_23270, partial [Abditibacteriales bacterium]|nr:hypothetical protein [Abditibacteriales bacterium]